MTTTRKTIATKIADETGIPYVETKKMVKNVIDGIKIMLSDNNKCTLRSFGSFVVRPHKERIGHNPKTMEKVLIPSGKRVSFRPSKKLNHLINHSHEN